MVSPPPLKLRAEVFFESQVKGHKEIIFEQKGGTFLKGGLGKGGLLVVLMWLVYFLSPFFPGESIPREMVKISHSDRGGQGTKFPARMVVVPSGGGTP